MTTQNNKNSENDHSKAEDVTESKYEASLSLAPYILLAVLRVVLTLIPQTGYIQPDEFFQSVEIVNEDIFNVEATRPWEFNVTKPIRSVTVPYLYAGLPNFLLKCIAAFLKLWFDQDIVTTYSLLVIPRLSCCLISFLNDWSLYKICNIYGQNYKARLMTLASSYVLLVYATHTFSNGIEMSLVSVLIYYVAECMHRSDQVIYQDEYLEECYSKTTCMKEKVQLSRLRKSLPGHSFSGCVMIASITVMGVFNRPTFLAFAFIPVFLWLHRGLGSKHIGLLEFHIRILLLGLSAIPMTVFLILVDSFYYGYLTWNEILQKKVTLESNFVVTPYNFIQYNAYTSNLANHGLHPRITHFLLNIPLLYNVLGIVFISTVTQLGYRLFRLRWSQLPRIQSVIGLMTLSCIVPVALLSIFPHQEPRFLIPITLPLVFLNSQKIRNINEFQNISKNDDQGYFKRKDKLPTKKGMLLTLWYLINMMLVLFFGFVHQAGVYPLVAHFSEVMKEKPRLMAVHLVTSFVYPLPVSLLHVKQGRSIVLNQKTGVRYQTTRDFFTYEMGLSDTVKNSIAKINSIIESSEQVWKEKRLKYKVYLAIPTSRLSEFQILAFKSNVTYKVEQIFYPHLTTEVMPDLGYNLLTECDNYETFNCLDITTSVQLPFKYFSYIIHQCGLALLKINVPK